MPRKRTLCLMVVLFIIFSCGACYGVWQYRYYLEYRDEDEFFESNAPLFATLEYLGHTSPNVTRGERGCLYLALPPELQNITQIDNAFLCRDSQGVPTYMSFQNPLGDKEFAYVPGYEHEDHPPKGLFIGNSPFGGTCTHRLSAKWFICYRSID
jgi:hypothetical protein